LETSSRHVFNKRTGSQKIAPGWPSGCWQTSQRSHPVDRGPSAARRSLTACGPPSGALVHFAAFPREMITPKVAVSSLRRALPARVWQLSRLTLACNAFDDRRTGADRSGAEGGALHVALIRTYARRRSYRMTTWHASMQRGRGSSRRSCDKLVIKQCFRGPRPTTSLFPRTAGGAIAQRNVGLRGSRPGPRRDINFKRNNLEL
jgi:hypothetical protein